MSFEKILEDNLVDYCIVGEGESVIPEFAAWVLNGKKGAVPNGLRWMENGLAKNMGDARMVTTDEMPFIPSTVLKCNRYHKNSFPLAIGKPLRWGFMIANRGCRFSCAFCTGMSRQSYEKLFRVCKPQRCVDEMIYQFRECDRTIISIEDDLFTGDRKWTLETCELLEKEGGGKIPWIAQTRFDCIDEELARAMRRAGCIGLTCGVESGSDAILNNLGKRQDAKRIKETGLMLKRLGFATRYSAMIGSPGETMEDFKKTASLFHELNPLTAQMAFCTPYPDTLIADEKDIDAEYKRFESPSRNLSKISGDELSSLRFDFYFRYYLSYRYIFGHAREWLSYLIFNPRRAFGQIYLFIRFMMKKNKKASSNIQC